MFFDGKIQGFMFFGATNVIIAKGIPEYTSVDCIEILQQTGDYFKNYRNLKSGGLKCGT